VAKAEQKEAKADAKADKKANKAIAKADKVHEEQQAKVAVEAAGQREGGQGRSLKTRPRPPPRATRRCQGRGKSREETVKADAKAIKERLMRPKTKAANKTAAVKAKADAEVKEAAAKH
jgi:membrane protein involved in colicin uptake